VRLRIDNALADHYRESVREAEGETERRESESQDVLRRRIAELEAALATTSAMSTTLTTKLEATSAKLAEVMSERDRLRHAYDTLREQMELMRRRIFVAKAERVDVRQLEIEFAEKKAELEALAAALGSAQPSDDDESDETPPNKKKKKPSRPKPKGRRDLFAVEMPEERVELLDAELEGKALRIGFEESAKLGYRRAGPVRIVIARATYKIASTTNATKDGASAELFTVPKPKELLNRCLLAPSMLAHILMSKYGFGIPFYRCEEMLAKDGIALDRSSMCRYAEDVGASLGAIVEACAKEAKETAFCLATDATGVAIQPEPLADKSRQPCKKGHFFVVLADRDHVFFEYQSKHSSAAVCEMFRGFSGYIQADAHVIYDALYRGEAVDAGADPPEEVACWSHARRKFWEAAMAKYALGREGLFRIRILFEHDAKWADLPPQKRHALRLQILKPLLDDFFNWAKLEHEKSKSVRGLVASAFGYVVRQEDALRRFLDDGRLSMHNNRSERALRHIATGRKAWLFFGSDDHAAAAANLFSLIASCKLHALDAEAYLTDVIRVMPYWPRERYIELAPKYWAATRARLDAAELAKPLSIMTVPTKLTPPAENQPSAT
jgi:transposase